MPAASDDDAAPFGRRPSQRSRCQVHRDKCFTLPHYLPSEHDSGSGSSMGAIPFPIDSRMAWLLEKYTLPISCRWDEPRPTTSTPKMKMLPSCVFLTSECEWCLFMFLPQRARRGFIFPYSRPHKQTTYALTQNDLKLCCGATHVYIQISVYSTIVLHWSRFLNVLVLLWIFNIFYPIQNSSK